MGNKTDWTPYKDWSPTAIRQAIKVNRKKMEAVTHDIKLLQLACEHKSIPKKNQNFMWAPGHVGENRFCNTCGQILGPVGSYSFIFHDFGGKEDIVSSLLIDIKSCVAVSGLTGEVCFDKTDRYVGRYYPPFGFEQGNKRMEPSDVVNKVKEVCRKNKIRLEVLPYVIN